MKISKSKLKQIIKEELENVLGEQSFSPQKEKILKMVAKAQAEIKKQGIRPEDPYSFKNREELDAYRELSKDIYNSYGISVFTSGYKNRFIIKTNDGEKLRFKSLRDFLSDPMVRELGIDIKSTTSPVRNPRGRRPRPTPEYLK
mgnify:CR=1 FL=1